MHPALIIVETHDHEYEGPDTGNATENKGDHEDLSNIPWLRLSVWDDVVPCNSDDAGIAECM